MVILIVFEGVMVWYETTQDYTFGTYEVSPLSRADLCTKGLFGGSYGPVGFFSNFNARGTSRHPYKPTHQLGVLFLDWL